MATMQPERPTSDEQHPTNFEFGGLKFVVVFRGAGATLQVYGDVDGNETELLRFDDFADDPHYHYYEDDTLTGPHGFDRDLGVPMDWMVAQVQEHLHEWIARSGIESHLPEIDYGEISRRAGELRQALIDCVPDGFVRVPGCGLQKRKAAS